VLDQIQEYNVINWNTTQFISYDVGYLQFVFMITNVNSQIVLTVRITISTSSSKVSNGEERIMREVLKNVIEALKTECDYLEIRLEENETTNIVFKGENLDQVSKKAEKGGFVRALYKGGWGEVSFNNVNNLEEYAKKAIKQAKIVGKSESRLAAVPVVQDQVKFKLKSDPRKVSFEEKIEMLKRYNDIVLNYNKVIKSSTVKYNEVFRYLTFINSEGTCIYQEQMDMGGAIMAIASDESNRQMAFTTFGSSNDFSVALGLEEEIKKSCQLAVDLLSAPKVKAGEYTVIADSELAGVFVHEAFGHLSEADGIYEDPKQQEIMKLGRELGRQVLNIYDSGLVEGCRGYLVYDDEGVKTEKTYLIKEGKLVGRLHSRQTAGIMGEKPTGNARAVSYKFPPICRMRCTCIEEGTSTFEEMLQGIKLGILACSSLGGETNGELFTFSAQYGYMIRDGKIAELVRDVNLSGNVFTTLNNIDMIGNKGIFKDGPGGCGKNMQFPLPVSEGGPYIRIQKVVVGGEE
jgi:TldD protein